MRRVLLIDDDADIRATVKEILEDERFVCDTAAHGAEALALLERGPLPDLILLDLSMPVMDGAEFRRRQVQEPRLSRIPTVVLSASGNLREKTRELGLSEVLPKPVDFETLVALVERYCGGEGAPAP